MRLELRHISPYLPYGLKAENCLNQIVEIKGLQNGSDSVKNELWWFKENNTNEYLRGYLYECKPILRPLRDLEDFSPAIWEYAYLKNEKIINRISYLEVKFLLENHFDVFGLIEEGLAIDKNTLDQLKT